MTGDASLPNQIHCPRCNRLITYPKITADSIEKCPHCDMDFIVTANMLLHGTNNIPEEVEIYTVKEDITPLTEKTIRPFHTSISEIIDLEEEKLTWQPIKPPPRRLFIEHTFSTPFSKGFRSCFLILFIVSLIMGYMTSLMLYYLAAEGAGSGSLEPFVSWVLGLVLTVSMVLIGVVLLFVLGTLGSAIFQDTFEGCDSFVSWPRDWLTNMVRSSSYILIAFFWGGLPAFITVSLLPGVGPFKLPIIIICESILFPLFFLSAFDSNSPVMLYSTPVWKSFWHAWQAWKSFYLLTIPLGAVFVLFMNSRIIENANIKIFISAIFLPVVFIVYLRLLGRLARYCSGHLDETDRAKELLDVDLYEDEDLDEEGGEIDFN